MNYEQRPNSAEKMCGNGKPHYSPKDLSCVEVNFSVHETVHETGPGLVFKLMK